MKPNRMNQLVIHLVLLISALIVLMPVIWMISVSLSSYGSVFVRRLLVFPTEVSLDGYRQVFAQTPYFRWFLNSVFISVTLTSGQLILGVFAAYAFSRYEFRWREPLFVFVLCTMMIPPQSIMLPLFMVVNELDWVNTYKGVIIPHLANGYAIFVLRQFFLTIPRELDESSQIDGCHALQTMYHVYIRSAVPALVSVGLIQLVRNWNDYYWALVVLMESRKLTLPLGIVSFRDESVIEWVPTMAAASMSIVPVLVIYVIGQKYFVQTHARTGIK